MTSKTLRAALLYTERFGFHVFPVQPKGKAPLTERGHLNATRDKAQIQKWWERWPDANVGVAVKPSGLAVLDFDTKSDKGINAYNSLADIESEFHELPPTPHALTSGGGIHFFFSNDGTLPRAIGIRPGVDFLGDGYVLVAPSVGKGDAQYEWEASHRIDQLPLAPVPEWLLNLLKKDWTPRPAAHPDLYWEDMLKDGIPEGQRNESLFKICAHLLRRYASERLTWQIIQSINKTKCKPPLELEELCRVFQSILDREERRKAGRMNQGSVDAAY